MTNFFVVTRVFRNGSTSPSALPGLFYNPSTAPICVMVSWGPFLEGPGNLTGLKSYFEIKVSRKVGYVLTSNEVHFASLAGNFTIEFSKLLKLPPGMENETA